MSTTYTPDVASTLASIRRVLGRHAAPPLADGERISVPMLMLDSTQRSIADAAEHDRGRRDARDRLDGMAAAAQHLRSERFRTGYRDAAMPTQRGSLAPLGTEQADPALSAMHLSRVASTARSEAETAEEAQIAARAMTEATAGHDAAMAARKTRFATAYRTGGQ